MHGYTLLKHFVGAFFFAFILVRVKYIYIRCDVTTYRKKLANKKCYWITKAITARTTTTTTQYTGCKNLTVLTTLRWTTMNIINLLLFTEIKMDFVCIFWANVESVDQIIIIIIRLFLIGRFWNLLFTWMEWTKVMCKKRWCCMGEMDVCM